MIMYAKVGESEYTIDLVRNEVPEGYVPITEERPEGDYVVGDSGEWIKYIPVPSTITKRQAMLQLNKVGLYQSVMDMINASNNIELKIEFEYTSEFERNSTFIASMSDALNLTDKVVDELFVEAAKL